VKHGIRLIVLLPKIASEYRTTITNCGTGCIKIPAYYSVIHDIPMPDLTFLLSSSSSSSSSTTTTFSLVCR